MRRRSIPVVVSLLTAGCGAISSERTFESHTTDETTAGSNCPAPTTATAASELSVRNERSESVTVTTDNEQVYAASIDLQPDGIVDRTDVFPDRGTYTITAEADNEERQASLDVSPDDGRSIVNVGIEETIEIGTPRVVTTETATPCP